MSELRGPSWLIGFHEVPVGLWGRIPVSNGQIVRAGRSRNARIASEPGFCQWSGSVAAASAGRSVLCVQCATESQMGLNQCEGLSTWQHTAPTQHSITFFSEHVFSVKECVAVSRHVSRTPAHGLSVLQISYCVDLWRKSKQSHGCRSTRTQRNMSWMPEQFLVPFSSQCLAAGNRFFDQISRVSRVIKGQGALKTQIMLPSGTDHVTVRARNICDVVALQTARPPSCRVATVGDGG